MPLCLSDIKSANVNKKKTTQIAALWIFYLFSKKQLQYAFYVYRILNQQTSISCDLNILALFLQTKEWFSSFQLRFYVSERIVKKEVHISMLTIDFYISWNDAIRSGQLVL